MSWTDGRVALLTKLWASGLSASQVAAELGGGLSRNAVIGKATRLGLPQRRTTTGSRPGRKPRDPGFRREPVVRMRKADGALTPHLPAEPAPPPVAPLHIALDGLERHHCRWPFGEGPFTFCGHHNGPESPYCAYHARIGVAKRA